MDDNEKNLFEKKIAPILTYVGAIGATLMCIAYIIVVFVLIIGFKGQNIQQTIIFATVNAAVGFIIMQFLKIQGISFAKSLPYVKEIIKEYYYNKTKDKKLRSIKFYWIDSVTKDVLIKAFTVGATTCGLIYIVIQGSNDYNLLLLAAVNLVMFICFGLLSLNGAYEFYLNKHVPYMLDQINKRKEKEECSDLEILNSETCRNK